MFAGAGLLWVAFTLLVRRWGIAPVPATAAVSVVSGLVAVPAWGILGDPTAVLDLGGPLLPTQIVVQGVFSGIPAVLASTTASACSARDAPRSTPPSCPPRRC